MNTKKTAALVLALALSLGLSAQAFAEGIVYDPDVDSQTQNVTVSTRVEPTYTVLIPESADVDFNETKTDFGQVGLDEARLEPNHGVKVTLTAEDNRFEMVNSLNPSKTIPYSVTWLDDPFTEFTFVKGSPVLYLNIEITQDAWNAAAAGDYSDTVTFTVEYVETQD